MRILLVIVPMLVAACRVAPHPVPRTASNAAVPAPPEPAPAATHPFGANGETERRIRAQQQYIEALMSQNDALAARLCAPDPAAGADAVKPDAAGRSEAPAPPRQRREETMHAPNADGMIDLTLDAPMSPGQSVNPFSVRTVPADSAREITIRIGGVIIGTVSCAVINDRLLAVGESLESLIIDRIEPDAVILRRESQRLRLPVSGKAVRVRMPL
jgi:hypothetical protein